MTPRNVAFCIMAADFHAKVADWSPLPHLQVRLSARNGPAIAYCVAGIQERT